MVALLRDAEALLFDFDGPLCDVFAGLPASRVARELEPIAGRRFDTDDPLEVVRQARSQCDRATFEAVEDALIAAEMRAVRLAVAEAAGFESLRASAARGVVIAVVTNNAAAAAEWFVDAQGSAALVSVTVGREYRYPERMKPDPWPLLIALDQLGVDARRSVLIGDSRTDIEAAHAAGVPCVAFANKPGKRALFEAAGAAFVVDDMAELRDALTGLGESARR